MENVGPYRLEVPLGRGSGSTVWRAVRRGPVARVVAVKRADRTDRSGRDRLRAEAAVLADLDHPHIVRMVDVLDDGDGLAVVMGLARGGSLHDLLVERGRLGAGSTVAVLAPVADALHSAHRRGVLHGDVKPSNILLTGDGEPLLGDFGVARHLGRGAAGPAEGTAGYVDPVVVSSGRPEPANDVYGLAAVAHLCLTGRLPGRDDHPAATPAGPDALLAAVRSGLSPDPARRPSALELARALRAAVPAAEVVLPGVAHRRAAELVGGAVSPPPVPVDGPPPPPDPGTRPFGPRPPRPERRRRRSRRGAVLAGGALVGAALAAALIGRADAGGSPGAVEVDGRAAPEGRACPSTPALDVPPGGRRLRGDLRGDGCPVPVVWDGRVMHVRLDPDDDRPRRYAFDDREGGAGQLLLGDWDCDGADSPAYYQPATGEVSYFAYVPERESAEVRSRTEDSGVTGGRARVVDGRGCETVAVDDQA